MRILIALLTLSLLGGCGFQLRGEARLPAVMVETWLQAPDPSTAFIRELGLMLRANGVRLNERADATSAVLRIHRERMSAEPLTISGQARVREFVLIFDVDFELSSADGDTLIPRETLRLTRDYSFDEQEILAGTREEEFLRDDLRRAMAAQLLRRLEALGAGG